MLVKALLQYREEQQVMQNKGKYYITTAIAYTSGKPHIGNSYEIVLADCIARYKRADGYDVRFMTGSDEHGQKIESRAARAGKSPKEFVDEVAAEIRRLWDLMGTSYDRFIRTTDPDHELQIQKIFRKLYEQGDIYLGHYSGMYCQECEAFYTASQIEEEGKCPVCGNPVHQAQEDAYFFRMKKYADRLIEHINTHPEFIQPVSRKNEMMNNFLLPGLQDLCVSRSSFSWGIPVDFAPGHVVYVWLDALSNYITGLGYDADGNNDPLFDKYWPADLHLIGKDIVRFHTIYWPIFLMALGVELPKQVFGHPWLLQGGEKMSKTKGNVIYADDLVDIFGVDAVRYFVVHEMPYENDGVITWELVAERINSDLANTLGNLVNRTIAMSNKYLGGTVRDNGAPADESGKAVDEDLRAVVTAAYGKVEKKMEDLRAADALTEIFAVFKRLNKYIDETEPWILGRDEANKDRLSTVLYNLVEGITMGVSLLAPFMPETAEKTVRMLGTQIRDFETLSTFGAAGDTFRVTEKPEILFARLDLKEVRKKVDVIMEKQRAAAAAEAAADAAAAGADAKPADAAAGADGTAAESAEADVSAGAVPEVEKKPEVTIDDFFKCQFQVGEVIACEAVKKSKKLLCSQVKIGAETRQIVSGIRKYYSPEEMVGKKVMVITNLKPAKLAGLMSEGMLLCAEAPDGSLALMTPDAGRDVPAGSEIG
ncbi:MAG: methionine--tRNA ligase [Eubacteriales bacterium]|nr:methionine--tRNA ligase [Eubacteriales bacterium]